MEDTLTTEDVVASFQQEFGDTQPATEPEPAPAPSEQGDPPASSGDDTAVGTQNEKQEQAPAQPATPPEQTQTPDNKAFAAAGCKHL